ncbi:MAG: type I-E CRISPR-associated protein Cse1/CasA [Thermoguttaceae bacterium]|nr:type I-E CRISPR-associated protein Cse1/CasA [Thermoguttaceae bacterium]
MKTTEVAMKNSSGESVGAPRSFNLVDEPWIPVVDAAGEAFKVGLRELFERSEELVDLAVGTLERISLYRLLICVAQRALNGPKNEDEWLEADGKLVAASLAYLDDWRDRFDLWGELPFLQVKALESVRRTKTDKLDFGLASGNNNTLFDQAATEDGRAHEPDWLARNLLVYLAFSPGGRIGVATINGRETDGGGASANAPYVESCMLFALVKGANIRQTIAWNMIPFNKLIHFPCGVGKPV